MQTMTIIAPASKSLSHRALIAAALADGTTRLANVLESNDTVRTREVLASLGAVFEPREAGAWTVAGLGGKVLGPESGPPLDVFVGESGTTCRLIMAVLAAGRGRFRMHGAGRMHDRPVDELGDVLEALGASIVYEEKPGCPPLVLMTSGLDDSGLNGVGISCDKSSQYLSGLLLAAPLGKGLTVRLEGERPVSWPYVSLTLDTLERFGIPFEVETKEASDWQKTPWRTLTEAQPGKIRFRVGAATYRPGVHTVENDWSGSSYFLAAGAIGPRPVRIRGLDANSLQGDAAILNILRRMGAKAVEEGDSITVYPSLLHGIDVDMRHCPDLVPTVAALAARAEGPTTIRGAAHLKIKESDRIEAPAQELRKVGCAVTVADDGMTIAPPADGMDVSGSDIFFSAHNDHRIAMSLGLLGLPGIKGEKGFEVTMDNPDCVSKSFPYFWMRWRQLHV